MGRWEDGRVGGRVGRLEYKYKCTVLQAKVLESDVDQMQMSVNDLIMSQVLTLHLQVIISFNS